MKILITGTAGFIGFHLAKYLLDRGDEVVGLDNVNDYYSQKLKYTRLSESGIEEEKIQYGKCVQSTKYPKYQFVKINLEDRATLEQLFKDEIFDKVCNLAAQAGVRYSIENPHAYIQSNIVGFMNILECCRHHKIQHLVYASSSSVYGNSDKVPFSEDDRVDYPVSLYAATKKSNELMAHTYSHLYQLPTTGLRFFTVYGPWGRPDMAPMLFADAITNDKPIRIFNNGEMERDFTYIDDIIEGIIGILDQIPDHRPVYQVLNIGNGSPVNLMSFIEIMENVLGKKAEKIFMPMQAGDMVRTWADTSRFEEITKYKSKTKIEEGVRKFATWFNMSNNRE